MIFYALKIDDIESENAILSQADVWGMDYPDSCIAIFATHADASEAVKRLYKIADVYIQIIQLDIIEFKTL